MKNVEITGNTYRTYDYSIFKRLDGNREVKSIRVAKIRKSIEKNGYIYNPLVVNEKYEIIDGQGRLEVLKEMTLPVDFVICEGAGVEECIALNANTTSWSMKDYVESYCELGYEDYLLLNELLSEYPSLKLNTIGSIASGLASLPAKSIKEGNVHISRDRLDEIHRDLDVATAVSSFLTKLSGSKDYYIYAAVFAARINVDIDRLFEVIRKNNLSPAPDMKTALHELSDLYNKNLRMEKRIYLYESYQKLNVEKFAWYERKHVRPTYK